MPRHRDTRKMLSRKKENEKRIIVENPTLTRLERTATVNEAFQCDGNEPTPSRYYLNDTTSWVYGSPAPDPHQINLPHFSENWIEIDTTSPRENFSISSKCWSSCSYGKLFLYLLIAFCLLGILGTTGFIVYLELTYKRPPTTVYPANTTNLNYDNSTVNYQSNYKFFENATSLSASKMTSTLTSMSSVNATFRMQPTNTIDTKPRNENNTIEDLIVSNLTNPITNFTIPNIKFFRKNS